MGCGNRGDCCDGSYDGGAVDGTSGCVYLWMMVYGLVKEARLCLVIAKWSCHWLNLLVLVSW
ncbi:uncharacterized protein BDV14DRAFT_165662 [Aspergillus stella-maris]|uniref:uncharacterized protein n=1 Tax=Aspergillus stella-maris TaxID=1810926 RepID=UPI003CCD5AA6